jgi:hypothetical protein
MPQGSEEADAAIARLEQIVAGAEAEVRRLLARLEVRDGVLSRESLANNREVIRQVRAAIECIRPDVERLAVQAAGSAAVNEGRRLGLTFTPQTAEIVDAVVKDRLADLGQVFGDASQAVAKAARLTLTTSANPTRLIADVAGAIGGLRSQASAAVDSMAMAAGRQATIIVAEQSAQAVGVEVVYLYDGPMDGVTRPFCRRHVGVAYSKEALDRLNNGAGQPKPVSAYLGGFRCRHFLVVITAAEAERRGIKVVR